MAQKQQFRSFDEMIAQSSIPVLVDFYAHWCGPCQLMAGILEQVKAQAGDNLSVVKIDTEKYPQIASQWQIAALPTIMLFHQGQPVDRIEGVMQAPALLQRIQSRLGEAAIR